MIAIKKEIKLTEQQLKQIKKWDNDGLTTFEDIKKYEDKKAMDEETNSR